MDKLTREDFLPFTPPTPSAIETTPPLGRARETLAALLRSRAAVFSIALLALLVLGAVLLPLFSPFDFASQNVSFNNQPPLSPDPVTGAVHLFGTDQLGRDLFVRVWYGARMSLLVAVAAALIDCVVGVAYGSVAGYLGGAADTVMMRVVEVVSGIPYLVVVLLLMAVLPQGVGTLILAYTLVGWTGMARLVRGQVAALSAKEFVIAARIGGAGMGRVLLRHLIPNTLGVILVHVTLDIPGVIFTEAFLSMLGMGIPPPFPSLGAMVSEGATLFQTDPLRLLIPGVLICLAMLAFHLLGDRLQDALDPQQRGRRS